MAKAEWKTTVNVYEVSGGKYYRCNIPKEVAQEMLNLKTDVPEQKVLWRIEKGKVVVEGGG